MTAKKTETKKTTKAKTKPVSKPKKRKKADDASAFITERMEQGFKSGKSLHASFLDALFSWCEKEESKHFH